MIERLRALEKTWRADAKEWNDRAAREAEDREAYSDSCMADTYEACADELKALIAELGQEVGAVADSELPGMWSASDFTGGDPDERCYSDRDLFASNLRSALGKHYDPEAGIVCSVALLAADKNTHPAHTSEARDASSILAWAVERWHAEVAQRPLVNVHRRSLDNVWRQVVRRCGEDDVVLLGPRHDDLVAAMRQEGGTP